MALAAIGTVLVVGPIGPAGNVPSAFAAPAGSSSYAAVTPTRILDSRKGLGVPTTLSAGSTFTLAIGGVAPVPANARAVVLNLTVTNASGPGYVTAWPADLPKPTTSVLNYERAGQTIANLVTVPLSATGTVSFYTLLPVDLIADVQGYYVPAATSRAGRLTPTTPTRVLDTRVPNAIANGSLQPLQSVDIDFKPFGVAGDANAVVLKVTVTEATAPGFWTVYASGGQRPEASNLNITDPGQTIPNQVISPLSNGKATVFSQNGGQLIVDLVGWYTGASAANDDDGLFVPVAPFRLVDTRDPANGPGVQPQANQKIEVAVGGRAGIPVGGFAAVLVNATVVDTVGPGYFSVWPGRTYRPNISSLNAVVAGQTLANHVITPVTSAGFDFFTQSGANLVADVTGWFIGTATTSVLPPAVPLPGPSGPPDVGGYLYEWASYAGGYASSKVGPQYSPFRWNPCRPIRYAVNLGGYGEQYRKTIAEAIDRISAASGLQFVAVADSTLIPTFANPWGQTPSQYRTRSGPFDIVIALVNESNSDMVDGSTDGLADFNWILGNGNGKVGEMTISSVVVDMGDVGGSPDWSSSGPGPVLLHELAHAIGLDHVADETQIMNAFGSFSGPTTYAAGDLRGLWQVGAQRGCDGF